MTQSNAKKQRTIADGWFIALITALTAVGSLSISIYLPSLPTIGRQFNVSEDDTKSTVTVFLIVFGFAQLVYGPASDKYGRRKVLLFGVLVFLAGTLGCAIAETFNELLFSRILQAAGAAAGHALGRAILRDKMEGLRLSGALATVAAAMALSPALGPTIGGYLEVWFGWRSTFWVLMTIAAFLFCLVLVFLPESNTHRDRDAMKFKTLVNHYTGLLRDRAFLLLLLCGGFIQMANFIWNAGAPFIYIGQLGLKANEYGLVGLCIGLGYVAGTLVILFLKKWPPIKSMLRGALLSSLAAAAMLLTVYAGKTTPWSLMLPMILVCSGMGLANPTSTAMALERHPETAGSASSLLGAAQIAMGALGTSLLSWIHGGKTLGMAILIAVVCLLSLFFGSLVPKTALENGLAPSKA